MSSSSSALHGARREEMTEDDGREQDGDPDGDPAFVEVLRDIRSVC